MVGERESDEDWKGKAGYLDEGASGAREDSIKRWCAEGIKAKGRMMEEALSTVEKKSGMGGMNRAMALMIVCLITTKSDYGRP